ncbi:MAG: circularly permuted type 2 ATP-grasp protein [Verrucomicrobiota bacterium]|nr:circularly permuted type 2 ATP-grasp protein [Verrucomicrobiota bacterium]
MLAFARRYDHFRQYVPERDETRQLSGQWQPEVAGCVSALSRMTLADLRTRQDRLGRASRELGLHFAVEEGQHASSAEWQLDLFPRLIRQDEWRVIEKGLVQRARAMNAFVKDIYGEQRILKDGVLPVKTVLGDPAFHRELMGITLPQEYPITLGAVDLIKTGDGSWKVLENHFATPFGIAYALQNRRLLGQVVPELFESQSVLPVASFTARLAEVLRAAAPMDVDRPLTVLLTRGDNRQALFEEGFLARRMGAMLAQPADLLVRQGYVFLRTIQGLERVDVIYRRIETSSSDPVAFGNSLVQGVPGLVHCVRKGTVVVLNALGSGVADNRAILRHSDEIIRYYLREKAVLGTVPTFNGDDTGQLEWIRKHLEKVVLKPICDLVTVRKAYPGLLPTGSPAEIENLLRTHPHLVVGQPYLSPSKAPRFIDGVFQPRSVFLRAFIIHGSKPYVMPGGLTRQSIIPNQARITIMAEGMKDTWVLASTDATEETPTTPTTEPLEAVLAPGALPLSSRVAENLYWLGRYLERAENTAHRITVMESVRWDELTGSDRKLHGPLWRAMVATMGLSGKTAVTPRNWAKMTSGIFLNASDSASVLSCMNAAQWNANAVRDAITPEAWQSVNGLCEQLRNFARSTEPTQTSHREIGAIVVGGVAQIFGTFERTLLHDEGWRFLKIGQLLERAVATTSFLQTALPKAASDQLRHLTDDSGLVVILRILGSLDAYLREYRARPYLDRLARLLWQSPNAPSAVLCCLREICEHTRQIAKTEGAALPAQRFAEQIDVVCASIEAIPLVDIFPLRALEINPREEGAAKPVLEASRRAVQAETTRQLRAVEQLHTLLEDLFFSHQESVQAKQLDFTLKLRSR